MKKSKNSSVKEDDECPAECNWQLCCLWEWNSPPVADWNCDRKCSVPNETQAQQQEEYNIVHNAVGKIYFCLPDIGGLSWRFLLLVSAKNIQQIKINWDKKNHKML